MMKNKIELVRNPHQNITIHLCHIKMNILIRRYIHCIQPHDKMSNSSQVQMFSTFCRIVFCIYYLCPKSNRTLHMGYENWLLRNEQQTDIIF